MYFLDYSINLREFCVFCNFFSELGSWIYIQKRTLLLALLLYLSVSLSLPSFSHYHPPSLSFLLWLLSPFLCFPHLSASYGPREVKNEFRWPKPLKKIGSMELWFPSSMNRKDRQIHISLKEEPSPLKNQSPPRTREKRTHTDPSSHIQGY